MFHMGWVFPSLSRTWSWWEIDTTFWFCSINTLLTACSSCILTSLRFGLCPRALFGYMSLSHAYCGYQAGNLNGYSKIAAGLTKYCGKFCGRQSSIWALEKSICGFEYCMSMCWCCHNWSQTIFIHVLELGGWVCFSWSASDNVKQMWYRSMWSKSQ